MVNPKKEENVVHVGKYVMWGVVAIVFLIFALGSWYTVDAGQKAVVLRFGAVQGEFGEGLHFKAPLIDDVVRFDTRVIKTQVRALSYSKDAQVIDMNISINYRIGKSASEIYTNLGLGYADTVISPAIQNAVKQVIAKYDAQTLLDGYANASRDITNDLTQQLDTFGINVVAVNIVNHDYSDAFESSVEAKQLAIQNALKAENELQTYKFQADQKIQTARGESESIKLKADASAYTTRIEAEAQAGANLAIATAQAEALRLQKQEITPDLLKLRSIEVQKEYAQHWNGELPKTIMGSGQIPLLQLPSSLIE
jgi:prohibitin 2